MSREVQLSGTDHPELFHSLAQADYVTILGVSTSGRIPLVRQFRPALDRVNLELPGGLLDSAEDPASTAGRELFEETGFKLLRTPQLLGRLAPDSGRLENAMWCFYGELVSEPEPGWLPERGVERVVVDRAELRRAILDGEFDHALHIALIGLAITRGLFSWD